MRKVASIQAVGVQAMSNENGFTLIELIAVMVIISIIASVVVKKINSLDVAAKYKAIEAGVSQLNSRELLSWTNILLAPGGYTNDGEVFNSVDKELGTYYGWSSTPTAVGGQLSFKSESVNLSRQTSTSVAAARWN